MAGPDWLFGTTRPLSMPPYAPSSGIGLPISGIPKQTADRIIARLRPADIQNVKINVRSSIEPHIGLGAGTSLTLACVEAATRAVGLQAVARGPPNPLGTWRSFRRLGQLILLGGLIGDGGRAGTGSADFRPSSASESPVIPKVLYRVDWPSQWQVAVMQLRNAVGISGTDETAFFRRETPFPREEAALAAVALSFELPGCVMDRDFDGLRECLSEIRGCGFNLAKC